MISAPQTAHLRHLGQLNVADVKEAFFLLTLSNEVHGASRLPQLGQVHCTTIPLSLFVAVEQSTFVTLIYLFMLVFKAQTLPPTTFKMLKTSHRHHV